MQIRRGRNDNSLLVLKIVRGFGFFFVTDDLFYLQNCASFLHFTDTEFALHRNLLNFLMSEADKVSGL